MLLGRCGVSIGSRKVYLIDSVSRIGLNGATPCLSPTGSFAVSPDNRRSSDRIASGSAVFAE
jgi:hypothetical protein